MAKVTISLDRLDKYRDIEKNFEKKVSELAEEAVDEANKRYLAALTAIAKECGELRTENARLRKVAEERKDRLDEAEQNLRLQKVFDANAREYDRRELEEALQSARKEAARELAARKDAELDAERWERRTASALMVADRLRSRGLWARIFRKGERK